MEYKDLILEVKDKVGRIIFNRPHVFNAYSENMSKELVKAIGEYSTNGEVKVVVMTGTGKAFMAGADVTMLKAWTEMPNGKKGVTEILSHFFSPTLLERCPKPVIAAVNGLAFGMGCEIALGCDIRIACQSAKFGQPEINLGIMTGAGGSQRLARLVGPGKAMEMILTGDPVDAEEALIWGLVNQVVPDDRLDDAVSSICNKLAKKSSTALRLSKEAVIASHRMGLYEGIGYELDLFAGVFETEDAREGVAAFLEKRKPVFR